MIVNFYICTTFQFLFVRIVRFNRLNNWRGFSWGQLRSFEVNWGHLRSFEVMLTIWNLLFSFMNIRWDSIWWKNVYSMSITLKTRSWVSKYFSYFLLSLSRIHGFFFHKASHTIIFILLGFQNTIKITC